MVQKPVCDPILWKSSNPGITGTRGEGKEVGTASQETMRAFRTPAEQGWGWGGGIRYSEHSVLWTMTGK